MLAQVSLKGSIAASQPRLHEVKLAAQGVVNEAVACEVVGVLCGGLVHGTRVPFVSIRTAEQRLSWAEAGVGRNALIY